MNRQIFFIPRIFIAVSTRYAMVLPISPRYDRSVRLENLFWLSKQISSKSKPILMLENFLHLSKVAIMKTKENVQSHSPWTENSMIVYPIYHQLYGGFFSNFRPTRFRCPPVAGRYDDLAILSHVQIPFISFSYHVLSGHPQLFSLMICFFSFILSHPSFFFTCTTSTALSTHKKR